MNVLCVAAHPDDEVLGCGGTLSRLAAEGHRVEVVIMAEGCASREGLSPEQAREGVALLASQARAAGRIMGAHGVELLGMPDNRMDSVPLLNVVKRVEGLMESVRPEIVFTHCAGDLNIDHCVVHRAVLTATRPMRGCSAKAVYAFEAPSSTEWAFGLAEGFVPNVFWDISATLETKLEAMGAYGGEIRPFPHPRSTEALRARAATWGSRAGVDAAEAFMLVRTVI